VVVISDSGFDKLFHGIEEGLVSVHSEVSHKNAKEKNEAGDL
jgi:hypothetical protein